MTLNLMRKEVVLEVGEVVVVGVMLIFLADVVEVVVVDEVAVSKKDEQRRIVFDPSTVRMHNVASNISSPSDLNSDA